MGRMLEPEFVGRTYDDFLFRPQARPLASRREVSLGARLTRRLTLELPVVSANMDSVTEARMAKAMALEGGLGFVHRGMPIEAQAARGGAGQAQPRLRRRAAVLPAPRRAASARRASSRAGTTSPGS